MGTLAYRFRIRTAADDGDELVVTSLPAGPNPYLAEPPRGDGQTLNPITGEVTIGAYTVDVIDELGTIAVVETPWTEDFEGYADTAELLADWTEVDPSGTPGNAVWTLDAVDPDTGAKCALVSLDGVVTVGEDYRIQKVIPGLPPGATYQFKRRIKAVGGSSGFPQGVYFDAPTDLTVDGSGNLTVYLRIYITAGGTAVGWQWRFDNARLERQTTGEARVVTSVLADADGHQQLNSRRAFLEETEDAGSSWDVLTAGWINGYRLVNALRWRFTVGESRRVEQRAKVFEQVEAGFDRVSCLLGGPIIGDFGPFADLGRPRFQVIDVTSYSGIVFLQWTGGPLTPQPIHENTPPVDPINGDYINGLARRFLGDFDGGTGQPFPDLRVRLFDIETAPGNTSNPPAGTNPSQVGTVSLTTDQQDFIPVAVYGGGLNLPGQNNAYNLLGENGVIAIRWPASAGTLPVVGERFKAVCFPQYIDANNPLHWRGHPMDFVTSLRTLRGQTYDATSAAAVRAELGDDLLIELRITEASTLTAASESIVFGPFGVAYRINDAGEVEFFTTRRRRSDPPVSTITLDDLVDPTPPVFATEEGTAVNKVTFTTLAFNPNTGRPTSDPIDYLLAGTVTREATPDPASYEVDGDHSVTYALPGKILTTDLNAFVAAIGAEMFEERGTGAILTELAVLRGRTTARIGEEVVLDLPQLPTANPAQTPVSQRGTTPRIALVLRRTVTPGGPLLQVQDRGIAEAVALLPTFTVVASSTDPRKIATVAITNGAALTAAGVTVRVEMAVSGTTPTSSRLLFTLDPATDALTFDLPAVDAGSKVWVTMRAELAGQRPGPYAPYVGAQLDALDAPTALAGAVTGGAIDCTWALGANATDVPVEVLLRRDDAATFDPIALLPVGSTAYHLTLPDPSTDYVVGVRHHEAPPFAGVSATTTLATASDVPHTLSAPIDPAAFSDGLGTFGLEVTALELEAAVEVWVAVETAVGSLTAGAYAVNGAIPSVAVGRTRYTVPTPAPNDGLRRFLKARHTRTGWTASPFTAEVSVLPWALTPAPPPVDPTPDDVAAPVCVDVDVHSAISGTGEPVITSALTELPGHPRVIYDTTGLAQVRLQYQGNAADGAGPAGSLLVAECRPKESTDDADFVAVGVVAGPTVALDGTAGKTAEGGWFDLALTSLGDMEFRFLTRDGDDAARVQPKQLRLQFRRALPPTDPEDDPGSPPEENPSGGLLAHFLGTAGQTVDPACGSTTGSACDPDYKLPHVAKFLAWHDARCVTLGASGVPEKPITSFDDLTGNGNTLDFDAGTEAQTLGVIAQHNGRDVARIVAGQYLWPAGMMAAVTDAQLFVVCRGLNGDPNPTGNYVASWKMGTDAGATGVPLWAGQYGVPPGTQGHIWDDFGSTVNRDLGDPAAHLDEWRLYRAQTAAAAWKAALDGTEIYSTGTNTVDWPSQLRMGSWGGGGDTLGLNAQLDVRVIILASGLTADEILEVEAALAAYEDLAGPGGGVQNCFLSWADQSGNGNDAEWTTGPRPTGGADRVDLTGGAVLHLPSGMFDGYPVVELYAAVIADADPGGADDTIWTLGADPSEYPDSGGHIQEGAGLPAAVDAGDPATTLATLRLYHVRLSAAGGQILLDRALQATLDPVAALEWAADPTLGGGVTFAELRFYGLQTFHSDAERDAIYAEMVANYPDIPVDPPVPPVGDPGDPLPPVAGSKFVACSAKYNHLLAIPPFTGDFGNSLPQSPGVLSKLSYATTNGLHLVEFALPGNLLQRNYGRPIDYAYMLANLRAAFDDAGIQSAMATAYAAGVLPCVMTNDDVDLASRWGGPIPSALLDDYARQIKDVLGFNLPCYVRCDPVRLEKRRYQFIYLDGCVAQYTGPLHMGPVSTYIASMLAAASRLQKRVIFATNTVNGGDGSSGITGSRSGFYFQSATDIRRDGGAMAAAIRDGKAERLLGTWMRDWASNDDTGYLQRPEIAAAWTAVLAILNG